MQKFNYVPIKKPQKMALDSSENPDTQMVLDFWHSKANGSMAPSWQDIDLLELPVSVIPRVIVVDVMSDPLNFFYRFFGSWHTNSHKREMSGLSVNDFEDKEYRQEMFDEYASVVHRQTPVLFSLDIYLNDIAYKSEILRLPLSNTGRHVDGVLAVESVRQSQL